MTISMLPDRPFELLYSWTAGWVAVSKHEFRVQPKVSVASIKEHGR